MMKLISTATIFCTIYLTNLVHIAVSESSYKPKDFEHYLQRLGKVIEESPDIFPFTVTNNLIANLKETSILFKQLCNDYDAETLRTEGNYSPVTTLDKAIKKVFFNYSKSATDKWNKVTEIQFVDPIGFIAYLTKKHEDENSPYFMRSVEEFRKVMRPLFDQFLQRLEEDISGSSLSNLPFSLRLDEVNVIEDLKKTSDYFKEICVKYENQFQMRTEKYSPLSSLSSTINQIFQEYIDCAGNRPLFRSIQEVDPIGLNVYLTKKNISSLSISFIKSVQIFQMTMKHRLRLFNSKTSNADIELFRGNSAKKVHEIPSEVRERVTTEYKRFQNDTIDFFIEMAMEQRKEITMYRLHVYDKIRNYKPHRSSEIDDVQILCSPGMAPNRKPHAVCIYYQASSKNVLVYDSAMYKSLDPQQLKIVNKLYPFKKEIIFMVPITRQTGHRAAGPFVIIYATMLLLNADPAHKRIRSNCVHGDEALYMRLHILNMFANRRLTMMNY